MTAVASQKASISQPSGIVASPATAAKLETIEVVAEGHAMVSNVANHVVPDWRPCGLDHFSLALVPLNAVPRKPSLTLAGLLRLTTQLTTMEDGTVRIFHNMLTELREAALLPATQPFISQPTRLSWVTTTTKYQHGKLAMT